MTIRKTFAAIALSCLVSGGAWAVAEDSTAPKPVPVTRPQVKEALSAQASPTAASSAAPNRRGEGPRRGFGGFGVVNNGRMRSTVPAGVAATCATGGGTQGRRERAR